MKTRIYNIPLITKIIGIAFLLLTLVNFILYITHPLESLFETLNLAFVYVLLLIPIFRFIIFYLFRRQYDLFIYPKFLHQDFSRLVITLLVISIGIAVYHFTNKIIFPGVILTIIIVHVTMKYLFPASAINVILIGKNKLQVFDSQCNLSFEEKLKNDTIFIEANHLKFKTNSLEVSLNHLSKNSKSNLFKFLDIAKISHLQSE